LVSNNHLGIIALFLCKLINCKKKISIHTCILQILYSYDDKNKILYSLYKKIPVVAADMVAGGCNAEISGDNISPADNSKLPPVDEPTMRNGEPDVTPRVEDKDTSGDVICEGMGC
jgi:hypothetical protein